MHCRWVATSSLIVMTLVMATGCSTPAVQPAGRPADSQPTVTMSATAAASPASPAVCGRGEGTEASPLRGHGAIRMAGLVELTTSGNYLQAGVSTKFVWRVTGTGDAAFTGTGPNGVTVQPDWGPQSHGTSSTFDQPGEEWGMGFTFPTPGCWTIQTTRGSATASARVTVT